LVVIRTVPVGRGDTVAAGAAPRFVDEQQAATKVKPTAANRPIRFAIMGQSPLE
jgi:hypothetical protein